MLRLRIDDQGAVPAGLCDQVELTIAVDAEEPVSFTVPTNTDLELPVTLPHAGQNVLQFSVAGIEGELTDRNNAAVVQMALGGRTNAVVHMLALARRAGVALTLADGQQDMHIHSKENLILFIKSHYGEN